MGKDSFYTCIYCRTEKEKSAFNVEHVLQKGFGTYKNTFTLIRAVCKDCNQKLGDTIDEKLLRESSEGLYRFKHGVKKSSDFKPGIHGKNQSRVVTDGPFKGMELELTADKNKERLGVISKNNTDVAFRTKDGTYSCYFIDQLPPRSQFDELYPPHDDQIRILNQSKKNEISQILKVYFGFSDAILENHEIDLICKTDCEYTKDSFRAIAKMVFNYLAYCQNSELVLQGCFDPIRNFILHGTGDWLQFIEISKAPILYEKNGMAVSGHIVVLEISHNGSLIGRVSLFNQFQYRVLLAPCYAKAFVPKGHLFDPHGHKIVKLSQSSLITPPPGYIWELW